MPRGSPCRAALLLLPLLAAGSAGADEGLERTLRSGEVKERLLAVKRLGEEDRKDAEELLLVALEDRDGEVREAACRGLARKATEKSLRPLAELALQGEIRRVRIAAAAALGARLPEAAAKLLQTALGAKEEATAAGGAEALAEIRHPSSREKLQGALQNKGPYLRREAAQALGALRDPAVVRDLEPILSDPDIRARAGAVEGIARIGDPRSVPLLLTALQEPRLSDAIERRIVSAIRRILVQARDAEEVAGAVRKVQGALRDEKDGVVAARMARLLGSLGRAFEATAPVLPEPGQEPATEPAASIPPPPEGALGPEGRGPVGDPASIDETLRTAGLGHREPVCRRAAAWALGRVGLAKGLDALRAAIVEDADELVRFHSLRAYRRWHGAKEEAAFAVFVKALRYDKSALVREEAAVALGVKGVEGAAETLTAALKDRAWEVAVAAAVSLGKTRDPRALAGLAPLLESRDWRLRGAAVAGIGWAFRKEGIELLIPRLADPEVSVARTAWEFLKRLTDKVLPSRTKDWEAWWAAEGGKFELVDRAQAVRDAKRYGYAASDRDVYENLDVVVLESRGDKIESLLGTLEIQHRLTKSANVKKDGVQPFGVFVSNCTGEMLPDDHERVQWFVHAGGALFASCWAIDTSIGKEFPGTMCRWRGFPGQVLGQVRAEELPTESEYLRGVFPGFSRPIYELYGAYLIEVLDPERLEVLIDSPETAAKFNGCGNLAAWFTAGHGVVMGSSNHFDRQTMTKLQGAFGVTVKTTGERLAFAVDHFGFGWDRVRDLDAKGVFSRQADAEKEVVDLSAFRFLTNFVRRKRIIDL